MSAAHTDIGLQFQTPASGRAEEVKKKKIYNEGNQTY